MIIAKRIKGLSLNIELESKVEEIETLLGNINSAPVSDLFRLPSFCAGCPHNTSTKVPDDSFAFGGIGCHGMATFMPERKTYNLGQLYVQLMGLLVVEVFILLLIVILS